MQAGRRIDFPIIQQRHFPGFYCDGWLKKPPLTTTWTIDANGNPTPTTQLSLVAAANATTPIRLLLCPRLVGRRHVRRRLCGDLETTSSTPATIVGIL